jgi:hypothetical protein
MFIWWTFKAKLLTADSSKSSFIKPLNRFNESAFDKKEIDSYQIRSSLEDKKIVRLFIIF